MKAFAWAFAITFLFQVLIVVLAMLGGPEILLLYYYWLGVVIAVMIRPIGEWIREHPSGGSTIVFLATPLLFTSFMLSIAAYLVSLFVRQIRLRKSRTIA